MTSDHEQAVWAWARHLRSGGTTPWSAFRAGPLDGSAPAGRLLPSAAQLELVRRAALVGAPPALDAFAEVVLSRSGPGRGRAQQPLAWPGHAPRIGAPPIDPADVPLDELVRLAVGALTELVLTAPPAPAAPRHRSRLPVRPAFVLAGAPVTSSVVRRELAAAGHREGGRTPTVVVVAEPLDRALAEVWSARVQRGAPVRWTGFCRRWAGRERLPPAADAAELAEQWSGRVGADRVHVLVAPTDPVQEVAAVLGLRAAASGPLPEARVRDLAPAAVDALRRVNAVLAVRADGGGGRTPYASLLPLLDAPDDRRGLAVPDLLRDRLVDQAEQLAGRLSSGHYRVHGTPGALVPGAGAAPTRPRRADVLRVLVGASLRHLGPGPAASGGGA